MWVEAKLDPCNYINIKRLLAGDACSVGVKFKDDQIVESTPTFFSSNNIFPDNDEVINRIIPYRWYINILYGIQKVKINK